MVMKTTLHKLKKFYPKDNVYKLCTECRNYLKGKCTLFFDKKVTIARDYYCHGWWFSSSKGKFPLLSKSELLSKK